MKLISSLTYFDTKSKIHIQKEDGTVFTHCNKELGFNFDVMKIDIGNDMEFTLEQAIKYKQLCKTCLSKYTKQL